MTADQDTLIFDARHPVAGVKIKICSKCKTEKPISEFHIDVRLRDGLTSACKICRCEFFKAQRAAKKPILFQKHDAHVVVWRKEKAKTHRVSQRDRENQLAKVWREGHRAELSACRKRVRDANPEPNRAAALAYYRANREKCITRLKAKRNSDPVAHRQKIQAKRLENPESARQKERDRYARHPDVYRRKAHIRRARLAGNGGSAYNPNDVVELLSLQREKCAVCEKSIKKRFDVDHVIPIARGGSNARENIQLLCPSCNRYKAAKDPIAFMQSQGKLL